MSGDSGTDTSPATGDAASTTADGPAAFEHYRPADGTATVDPGVYRVVGTGDPVALLRVGDADDRRVTSGELVRVDGETLAAFEPAENPDGNRSTGATLVSTVRNAGWQFRTFGRGLRARPLSTLGALALLAAGYWGERVLPGPEIAFTLLALVGALWLVYLGSGG